jgi:hypothetical protein
MNNNIDNENNKIEEYTMGMGKVNMIAFIMIIPIAALILLPFILIWDYDTFKIGKDIFMDYFFFYLTPYCHCKEPLKVKHYKIEGAMPLIVMGIIPSIIGLIIGNGGILSFGIIFTLAAGGDIIALYMLRKLDNNIYVSDHPKKMGFIREIK